ncbi:MAG: hypothetical protein MJA32_04360 [Proteobacteria bacterium]|nr:hypothetical protein [Pseudomonadota bacterium]
MSIDYDPTLQALFRQAEQEFDRDAFERRVMARIDRQRRKTMVFWSAMGVVFLATLSLIAAPLASAVGIATQFLPTALVEIETGWLQQLLSPVNSVAAAIAIGALAIRAFYRRIFR